MPTSDTQSVATTLPARYYTDPDLFHDELERFYCLAPLRQGALL
jgi:hypothetical protein